MKNQDRNIRPDSFKHLQHGYNRKTLIYNSRKFNRLYRRIQADTEINGSTIVEI